MQSLPLVFHISDADGTYSATMDSPLQGAYGIAADVSISGDTIDISIPMIDATYHAILVENIMHGNFTQRGYNLKIDLTPGEYIPPRPQTPQETLPYRTQEVTFANTIDGYQLHGTLSLPVQYMLPGKKKFPAVVMITGSGTQNRDEEIYNHKPFAVIAHHLALNGIASLRYDDRAYGDSVYTGAPITTETNANDARAALEYLRSNVDRIGNIGALGHSEGGTIVFLLAASGDIDFAISLAGSTVRGDSILITQNQRLLEPQIGETLTNKYLNGLRRCLDYMQQNPNSAEWPEIDAELAELELPQQLLDNLKAVIASRSPWLDQFITYDPAEAITNTHVPVFAANGTLDMQVDCTQNLGVLRSLLPPNTATVIKEYPGLNHLMQEASSGMPAEYGAIEQTIFPALLQDIAKWINSLQ